MRTSSLTKLLSDDHFTGRKVQILTNEAIPTLSNFKYPVPTNSFWYTEIDKEN